MRSGCLKLLSKRGLGTLWFQAVLLAALLLSAGAWGQTTCFGKGSVLTCLDRSGAPAFQVICVGSQKYRTCMSQNGPQLTLSATAASASNDSSSAMFQSGGTGAVVVKRPTADPAFGAISPPSSADPAFGTPPVSPTNPAIGTPN